MVKRILRSIGFLSFLVLLVLPQSSFGQTSDTEPDNPTEATFKSRCESDRLPKGFPPCADSPAECASKGGNEPLNCIYLLEPIGGRPGYDLYYKTCAANDQGQTQGGEDGSENAKQSIICNYQPWYGSAIVAKDSGPFQAVLAYEPGKDYQGPFGLLYGYLGLVYNYMSGIIIAFVILIVIVGGVRIITAGGSNEGVESGKKMIMKAIIGMILWFTASVILYTINPTFFSF